MLSFKDFLMTKAALHKNYLEWGWIKPDGTLLTSEDPKVAKFIKRITGFLYKEGAIHADLLINFTEYKDDYKNGMDIMDIEDDAFEKGYIRFFIEKSKTSPRISLHLFFDKSNLKTSPVEALKKMTAPFEEIILSDVVYGTSDKIEAKSQSSLFTELTKRLSDN